MKYKIKTKHLKRIVEAAEKNGIKKVSIETRRHTLAHPNRKDAMDIVLENDSFYDFIEFHDKGKKLVTDLIER